MADVGWRMCRARSWELGVRSGGGWFGIRGLRRVLVERGEAAVLAPAGGLLGAAASLGFGAVLGGWVEAADAEEMRDGFADVLAIAEAQREAGEVVGEAIEVLGLGGGLFE